MSDQEAVVMCHKCVAAIAGKCFCATCSADEDQCQIAELREELEDAQLLAQERSIQISMWRNAAWPISPPLSNGPATPCGFSDALERWIEGYTEAQEECKALRASEAEAVKLLEVIAPFTLPAGFQAIDKVIIAARAFLKNRSDGVE